MKIQNNYNKNHTNFNGYDARKLKGFVMNSNYANIAGEMKKIGDIENFKVYLFQRKGHELDLVTDKFEKNNSHKGCWAQDIWGIVKNNLLAYENAEKSEFLQNMFKLKPNKFKTEIHNKMNVPQMQSYIDLLYNLPIEKKDGKPVIKLVTEDGVSYIDKKLFDAEFKINTQILKNIYNHTHVRGGNYFLTRNAKGEDELLIGKGELKKFSIDEIKQMFMTDKIHIIPQADFHLDLFIRPLKDKKVLIADDEMMLQILNKGFKKIQEAVINSPASEKEKFREPFVQLGTYFQQFKNIIEINPYSNMKEVENALIKAGYEPIKVPGRIFEIMQNLEPENTEYLLKHSLNYINANTLINDKNELIYITNKSSLDDMLGLTPEIKSKINFSIENEFLEAVKPHVDKVYFISGENNALTRLLPEYNGGIHCMAMEVPN